MYEDTPTESQPERYVAALVAVERDILLVRRTNQRWYDLPSGLIEAGERTKEGLIRILTEQIPGLEPRSIETMPDSEAFGVYAPDGATRFLFGIHAERDPKSIGRGRLEVSAYPRSEPRVTAALAQLLRTYVNHQA